MYHDDLSVIEAHLSGDPKAFEELVSRYSTSLYNFIYRLCGNKEEAYDLTQEVFIKIWKNIGKYNPKQRFSTWMFSIARYTTIDWFRKKKNILFSTLDKNTTEEDEKFEDSLIDTEPLAHELFEREEQNQSLQKGLERLSLDQRTVIVFHHANDLTFKEIAEIMHKPLNTVQSHYRRGIISLRKHVLAGK